LTYIKFKETIVAPLPLVVMFIMLVLVVIDINERLLKVTNNQDKLTDHIQMSDLPHLILDNKQHQKIMSLYNQYIEEEKDDKKTKINQGMSAELQRMQEGKLKQLYIDNKKIELKAIVNNLGEDKNTLSVLLLVSDTQSKIAKVETFHNEANVYGYQLQVKNNRQVSLTKQYENDMQTIILTMYQSKKYK